MSYNSNIPLGTDKTLISQSQLRTNFQIISEVFADNHTNLTNLDDELLGMHTVITMQAVSDPTTGAGQVALYNKLVSSVPQLFYRPQSNATPIQMTYPSISTSSATVQNSFIPGPFVVYGGLLKAISNGQVVTLTPMTTLLYVGLEAANIFRVGNPFVIPTNITSNQFTIGCVAFSPPAIMDAYYIAIGQ